MRNNRSLSRGPFQVIALLFNDVYTTTGDDHLLDDLTKLLVR